MLVSSDSFTGTSGLGLTGHTGEFGATWLKQAANPGDIVLTDAGRIRGNTQDTDGNHFCSRDAATNEYDVEADFVVLTVVPNQYTTILGRMVQATATDIYVTYNTDRFILNKEVANVGTFLGESLQTLTPGNTYRVKLQIRAALTKVFLDGVEILSVATPSDIPGIGRGGVSFYADGVAPATNTTGIHLDKFLVTDLVSDTAWLPIVPTPRPRPTATPVYQAVLAPVRVPGPVSTVLAESSPARLFPPRRPPAHPSFVAPLRVADITATVPTESWQGSAPATLVRARWIALHPISMVRSFDTSARPASDTRAQFSMSVPYRLDLLQYQTLVGPISPLPAGSGVGGSGRGPLSMGVPYRLDLLQYQQVSGPVFLSGTTPVQILWAPQLVTREPGLLGWGRVVSSGLTPPGIPTGSTGPSPGTIFLRDTFTDASGLSLVSHTGELGATWTQRATTGGAINLTNANRVRQGVTSFGLPPVLVASGVPTTSAYDLTSTFFVFSLIAGNRYSWWVRTTAAARTGYELVYDSISTWSFLAWTAGSSVTLGTFTLTPTVGSHVVSINCRVPLKQIFVDSVSYLSVSDESLPIAGLIGIGIFEPAGGASTNTTAIHIDDILGTDP